MAILRDVHVEHDTTHSYRVYTVRIDLRVQGKLTDNPTKGTRIVIYYDNYAQELKERLRAANQVAKENLKEEKQKAKQYSDRKAKKIRFKLRDKVLLHEILR